jgi:hypothetical protein
LIAGQSRNDPLKTQGKRQETLRRFLFFARGAPALCKFISHEKRAQNVKIMHSLEQRDRFERL